jgi:hypothetical protein
VLEQLQYNFAQRRHSKVIILQTTRNRSRVTCDEGSAGFREHSVSSFGFPPPHFCTNRVLHDAICFCKPLSAIGGRRPGHFIQRKHKLQLYLAGGLLYKPLFNGTGQNQTFFLRKSRYWLTILVQTKQTLFYTLLQTPFAIGLRKSLSIFS